MSNALERLRTRETGSREYAPLEALAGTVLPGPGSILSLPADKLHPFAGHTFKRRPDDDPYILALEQSIRDNGILEPLVVRPHPTLAGEYEVIAGHTRLYLGQRAGLSEFPCLYEPLGDDEAIQRMGETNIQRPDWLPSERAATYKAHLEASERQEVRRRGRPQILGQRLRDREAERWGISGKMWEIYMKLNDLTPELLDMVDAGRVAVKGGYQLSYLSPDDQIVLWRLLQRYPHVKVNERMAIDLRNIDQGRWRKILGIEKEKKPRKVPMYKFGVPKELVTSIPEERVARALEEPAFWTAVAEALKKFCQEEHT